MEQFIRFGRSKKAFSAIVVLCLVFAVGCAACFTAPSKAFAASKVKLNKTSATLLLGKSTTLKLSGAKASKVKWTSSKKSVATVKNGKVKARKPGTTTITAKYKGKKYKCSVKVRKLTMAKIGTQYFISKRDGGSWGQAVVTCYKHGKGCKNVKYSSSNKRVASVDSDGVVRARGLGAATIKAKAHGVTVKQKVVVKKNIFGATSVGTLYVGCEGEYIGPTCLAHKEIEDGFRYYECGWYDTLSFSSSNSRVATVNDDGLIEPKGEGQAVISIRAHGQTAQRTVTVKKPWVNMAPLMMLYYDGPEGYVDASCGVHSYCDDAVVYSSSNPAVVQVDRDGCLTPLNVGKATITARVHGVVASRPITVELAPFKMNVSQYTLRLDPYGDGYEDWVSPLGVECGICGNWCERVKWTSSNPAVVQVDSEYGDLLAKAQGTATVTASAHGTFASCVVTVKE